MNSQCRIVHALVLAFLLILHGWPNATEAARGLGMKGHSAPGTTLPLSSQNAVIKGSHEPFKRVDSSFRRIPPSRSNPTQNK